VAAERGRPALVVGGQHAHADLEVAVAVGPGPGQDQGLCPGVVQQGQGEVGAAGTGPAHDLHPPGEVRIVQIVGHLDPELIGGRATGCQGELVAVLDVGGGAGRRGNEQEQADGGGERHRQGAQAAGGGHGNS
jgi:hypothetical protein